MKKSTPSKRNTRYPGRPNYVGPKSGLFFLVHHDKLFEHSHNIKERIKYIKKNKPTYEIKTRLWHLCRILPREISPAMRKAKARWDKAKAEFEKAFAKWEKANTEWDKANTEWDKAKAEWDKAKAEWDKAKAKWEKANAKWEKANAEALLGKLIPNHKWDGNTLVFSRK